MSTILFFNIFFQSVALKYVYGKFLLNAGGASVKELNAAAEMCSKATSKCWTPTKKSHTIIQITRGLVPIVGAAPSHLKPHQLYSVFR